MYKVKLNDEFKSDLNDISEYIFRVSFSKEITQKISDEITKKLLNLIIFQICIKIHTKIVHRYRIIWQLALFYKCN